MCCVIPALLFSLCTSSEEKLHIFSAHVSPALVPVFICRFNTEMMIWYSKSYSDSVQTENEWMIHRQKCSDSCTQVGEPTCVTCRASWQEDLQQVPPTIRPVQGPSVACVWPPTAAAVETVLLLLLQCSRFWNLPGWRQLFCIDVLWSGSSAKPEGHLRNRAQMIG